MPFVIIRDGETVENLITRFRASVQRSGLLKELKNRQFFRSRSERVRLAAQRAARRHRRRRRS